MLDRATARKATRRRAPSESKGLTVHRFAGVALGGGKTERTAVAVIEFYPESKRIFLRALRDKVKSEGLVSSDESLFHLLTVE